MNETIYREAGEMYRCSIKLGQFVWAMFNGVNVAIVTGIAYILLGEGADPRKAICCSLLGIGFVASLASARQLRVVDRIIQRSLTAGFEQEKTVPEGQSRSGWYQIAAGESKSGASARIGEAPVAMYTCWVYAGIYVASLACYGTWG